jgi:hypothetical protein
MIDLHSNFSLVAYNYIYDVKTPFNTQIYLKWLTILDIYPSWYNLLFQTNYYSSLYYLRPRLFGFLFFNSHPLFSHFFDLIYLPQKFRSSMVSLSTSPLYKFIAPLVNFHSLLYPISELEEEDEISPYYDDDRTQFSFTEVNLSKVIIKKSHKNFSYYV